MISQMRLRIESSHLPWNRLPRLKGRTGILPVIRGQAACLSCFVPVTIASTGETPILPLLHRIRHRTCEKEHEGTKSKKKSFVVLVALVLRDDYRAER